MNVIDVGMVDTSFIYFAINHLDAVGGIQVTASHNPIQYNGFKISGPKAKPIGAATGLDDIKRIATTPQASARPASAANTRSATSGAPTAPHVLKFLDLKRPLRVVVDGSNGMAGKMVPAVFGDVPNLDIVPLLFEITGSFVHEPNPLVESNLDMLKAKHRRGEARPRRLLRRRRRPLLLPRRERQDHRLRPWSPRCSPATSCSSPRTRGRPIVYDLRSSHVVADEVKAAGGVPKRDRVGHAFIKKTMSETKAVFGGELSGHFYFRDNFFADSGAIAFARLLSVLSAQTKPLSELIKPLLPLRPDRRNQLPGRGQGRQDPRAGREVQKAAHVDYLDGITVDNGDWWFNVRKSNTEPLLRLNLEAGNKQLLEEKFAELKKVLGEPVHGH